MNHFPGTGEISHKDNLARNLDKLHRVAPKECVPSRALRAVTGMHCSRTRKRARPRLLTRDVERCRTPTACSVLDTPP